MSMCCKCERYKGLLIYTNISEKFGTTYYSVVNDSMVLKDGKNPHCHSSSLNLAKQIANCFNEIKKKKCRTKISKTNQE